MSHYPTSAELQDFRRTIGGRRYGYEHPLPGAEDYALRDSLTRSLYPGAWPDEITWGIGATSEGQNWGVMYPDSTLVGEARREASAMRSRAFSSVITEGQRAVYHGGSARNACLLERSEGLPVPLDHYHMSGAQLA